MVRSIQGVLLIVKIGNIIVEIDEEIARLEQAKSATPTVNTSGF
jgi:hypothetical protein